MNIKLFSITLLLLVFLYLFLSRKVIMLRRRFLVATGHNNTPEFDRAIRAHANCGEYSPLVLLELFVLTQLHANVILFSILCLMILFGRFLHAYGLTYLELQNPARYWGRACGMMLTFACLLASAVCILIYAFFAG